MAVNFESSRTSTDRRPAIKRELFDVYTVFPYAHFLKRYPKNLGATYTSGNLFSTTHYVVAGRLITTTTLIKLNLAPSFTVPLQLFRTM